MEAAVQPCVSTGRSIHAVPSITPSPGEEREDRPETARQYGVPIALAESRPEDPREKASAEIGVAAVIVEGSPQNRPRAGTRTGSDRAPAEYLA